MFDDAEYQRMKEVYMKCIEEIKEYRKTHRVSLSETPTNDLYQPLFVVYKEISGVEPDFDAEEIMQSHYLARWKE
jgi:hypothetical protein